MSTCTWLQEFFVLFLRFDTAGGRRDTAGYWVIFLSISTMGPVLCVPHHTNSTTTCQPETEVPEIVCFTTRSCSNWMCSRHSQKGWQPRLLQSAATSHCSGFTFNACNFQQVELFSPKINLFKWGTCLGADFFFFSFKTGRTEKLEEKRSDRMVYFQKRHLKKIIFAEIKSFKWSFHLLKIHSIWP